LFSINIILSPSIFRLICRHFNGSPILCPINATSSSSYVFRSQYPRALHCRIVLIENISSTWKEKTSHNKFRIGIKTNNLKVMRNLRENSLWQLDRGARIFSRKVVCQQRPNWIYYICCIFMIDNKNT
jgi:hypothetical protein